MFLIYLQVLIHCEEDIPCFFFLDLPLFVRGAIRINDLNTHLVVHVLHQFVTGYVIHHGLMSFLAPVEIVHIDPILAVIIPRISNECNILTNVVRG